MMSNFLQNLYFVPFLLEDVVIMQDWELIGVLIEELVWKRLCLIEESKSPLKVVDISPCKTLKINANLLIDQEK